MKRILLTITIFSFSNIFCQNIDMDNYEIYISDTLIGKSDFIKNGQILNTEKAQKLEFKPIIDGSKTAYYLNGKVYSKGEIKNLKENGLWVYWHSNGQKAREGQFLDGKPNGTHKSWNENGQLRGIGNWKNGIYDGKWEMYNEKDEDPVIQMYKNGKLLE